MKNYRSLVRRIITSIAIILGLMIMFFISNIFLGNPVSAYMAKSKAQKYINNKYNHLDLEILRPIYNPKDGYYVMPVRSNTSIDTYFPIMYRDGQIFRDDYETTVLSGMNTMNRFCNEYKSRLNQLVQDKTEYVTSITILPEKLIKYNIDIDADFDKKLIQNVDIAIRSTGGIDAKHLSKVLEIIYDVMQQNGYAASGFEITGEYETQLIEIRNIKSTHIEDANLEGILQKAINSTEYDGITVFQKGLK